VIREAALFAYERYIADRDACALGLAALVAWLVRSVGAGLARPIGMLASCYTLWPVSAQVMNPVIGEKQVASAEAGRDDVVGFLEQRGRSELPHPPREEFMSNRYAD
jgi:hypothetical protein